MLPSISKVVPALHSPIEPLVIRSFLGKWLAISTKKILSRTYQLMIWAIRPCGKHFDLENPGSRGNQLLF